MMESVCLLTFSSRAAVKGLGFHNMKKYVCLLLVKLNRLHFLKG